MRHRNQSSFNEQDGAGIPPILRAKPVLRPNVPVAALATALSPPIPAPPLAAPLPPVAAPVPVPVNVPAPQQAAPSAPASSSDAGFREVLLAKKREVMAGMGMKFDAASKMGRVAEDDAVQIAHDEFINLRLNAIGWDQLRLMDEALDRLQTGEFGICLRCDEPISPRRLAVVPWAKYCVRCQEKIAAREAAQDDSSSYSSR